jgi:hypothetical protein
MANEQLEFKLGEDEEPATVAINEDGTAEQLEKPQAPTVETAQTTSQDLDQYSDKVQKRIDKLTARLRETERREQAAIDYARQVQSRMAQTEQQLHQTHGARLGEAKGRIETQALALKQIIKKAREEGDIDTETEAQERLTTIMLEQQRVREAEANQQQSEQQLAAQQQAWANQQQQLAQQAELARQQAQVDPRAEDWAERNEWFGRDVAMTAAARGIHIQLVTQEGFNPQSDDYYNELDRRIRESFPQKFQSASINRSVNRSVQTVAPASRSSGVNQSARRTVKLTPSQVAIAKKLGVPLEEYAKYVKE